MSFIDKIIEVSSSPTGGGFHKTGDATVEALGDLLSHKNGFFAFEHALEVLPWGEGLSGYPGQEWNNPRLWKSAYKHLIPRGIFFAQDAFGGQFFLDGAVFSFDPETAEVEMFSGDLEGWAKRLLEDYDFATGYRVAHAWQIKNGPLPPKSRLVPLIPFVLGGGYDCENLIEMNAVEGMRLRGDLACQLENLPDGASVSYKVTA